MDGLIGDAPEFKRRYIKKDPKFKNNLKKYEEFLKKNKSYKSKGF